MKQPRRKQKYCKATRSRSTKPSCTKVAEANEIRCRRTGKTSRPNVQAKRLSLSIGAALPPRLCERLPTTRVALRREAQGSHRDSRDFFARLWREMCVAARRSMASVGACVVEVAPVADGAAVQWRMQYAFCISHRATRPLPHISCSRNSGRYP